MKPYVELAYVGQFGEEMDFHTDDYHIVISNFHLIFTRIQKTQRYNRPFFGLRLCNRYITPYTVKLVF
ncbi:hypothetical protein HB82_22520 [Salmonella enterica subsp. enterica]|nr:hypothetical protein [Salmonella enterica subsp. enterica]